VTRLRAKGARSARQGPGDVFICRQEAVHANGRLSPKLCGMAHLPRDGTGRQKRNEARDVRTGPLDAANGEPSRQRCRARHPRHKAYTAKIGSGAGLNASMIEPVLICGLECRRQHPTGLHRGIPASAWVYGRPAGRAGFATAQSERVRAGGQPSDSTAYH